MMIITWQIWYLISFILAERNFTEEIAKVARVPTLPTGLELVFHDDFTGNQIDKSKWIVEVDCWGGGNQEKQCYVDHPDVLKVEKGALSINPKVEPKGYTLKTNESCSSNQLNACTMRQPVRSGRLHTTQGFKYGRFEMRAQLPKGKNLWPTFWMLPTKEPFGKWPASGEVDIMETKGHDNELIDFSLHHGASWPFDLYITQPKRVAGIGSGFHVFGVDWDAKGFNFYVDDVFQQTIETNRDWNNPAHPLYTKLGQPWTDNEFFLVINLAVAGNYFGPGWNFDQENDPKTWVQPYVIDYVKVYQYS